MATSKDPCKVITGPARATMMFVNQLNDTDKDGKAQDPQCATGILIKKSDKKTLKAIEKAIDAACKKKGVKNMKKTTKKFWYPLIDCDEAIADGEFEPDDPSLYEDMMFLRAKAYKLPGLVDRQNETIEDPDDRQEMCVSGYWFRFSITFKGFDNESQGAWVQLNNLMFNKKDDRLDGGAAADKDFDGYEDEDDDDDDEDEKPTRKSKRSSSRKGKRKSRR